VVARETRTTLIKNLDSSWRQAGFIAQERTAGEELSPVVSKPASPWGQGMQDGVAVYKAGKPVAMGTAAAACFTARSDACSLP
jgi:hypothetical protein